MKINLKKSNKKKVIKSERNKMKEDKINEMKQKKRRGDKISHKDQTN